MFAKPTRAKAEPNALADRVMQAATRHKTFLEFSSALQARRMAECLMLETCDTLEPKPNDRTDRQRKRGRGRRWEMQSIKYAFVRNDFRHNFLLCNKGRTSGFHSPSTLRVDRISGFHCWCAVSSVSCSRLYSLHPDNVAHSNLHYACRTLDVIHIFGSIFRFFFFCPFFCAIYLGNMICESKWLYSVSFNRKC